MVACTYTPEHIRYEAKELVSFSSPVKENHDTLFDIRYIKLETNASCLLGTIGQIGTVSDSLLFVLDASNFYLYAYSQKGEFLTCIGSKGNGPGEYLRPFSFFIDKLRDRLGVIDVGRQKVIYYRLKDFLFQSETGLPFETSCCAIADNGNILWNSKGYGSDETGNNYFVLTDSAFHILRTAVEKQFKSGYGIGEQCNVYTFQGKTYAYSPFDLSVWEIGCDSVGRNIRLELDGHDAPPYSFLMEKSDGGHKPYFSALEESDYVSYYSVREFADYYSVAYIVKGERFVGFFDKRTKSSYLYTVEQLGKMFKVGEMNYLVSGSFDEYSVFPLETSSLLEKKSDGFSFNKDLDILLQDVSPEDNQILMCIRMR